MFKLEKGQNTTKTAEVTAVKLNGEMSIYAKLIVNFITQQVAVAMAKKTKQYEKKIRKLEKDIGDRVLGDSTTKNGTRGGGRASKKKKISKTQTTTKSGPPQKSVSQSAQGQKSIVRSQSRGRSQQAGSANSGTPKKRTKKKQRPPKAHRSQHCRPQNPTAPNRAVSPRKGGGKLRLSSR